MNILKLLISMPKTIYFNFKTLPFKKAIKLPILVSHSVKLKKCPQKNNFICESNKVFSIRLGFNNGSFELGKNKKSYLYCDKDSKLVFKNTAIISSCFHIKITGNGNLSFGNNIFTNSNLIVGCSKNIEIGNDVLIGWNVSIFDSDGHNIYKNDILSNSPEEIIISNHCWITSNNTVLKGTYICQNSILASNSLINKKFDKGNVLIAGQPARIVSDSINWDY